MNTNRASFASLLFVLAISVSPAMADTRSDKAAFLRTVDESISGNRIVSNPFRFVGKRVDLHCTVSDIPDRNWFNADCSASDDEVAYIVIEHDSRSLEVGQSIRVIGTVAEPTYGTNAMGGHMSFPNVIARYIE